MITAGKSKHKVTRSPSTSRSTVATCFFFEKQDLVDNNSKSKENEHERERERERERVTKR